MGKRVEPIEVRHAPGLVQVANQPVKKLDGFCIRPVILDRGRATANRKGPFGRREFSSDANDPVRGYVDSSGIGELVSSFTAINKDGGQLKLLNLTQKLQDLLTITKLLTVFDVYDEESDALNSFK